MVQPVSDFGYLRIATFSPAVVLGNPMENAKRIIALAREAKKSEAFLALFPELSLTGYSCEDLFGSEWFLTQVKKSCQFLLRESKTLEMPFIFGAPYLSSWGNLYNCAVVVLKGQILGIIPKIYIPNYQEFYEKRWFHSGVGIHEGIDDKDLGKFLLSPDQIFQFGDVRVGMEICEDLWAPLPPSTFLATQGAEIILNLSASNEWVGRAEYRKELVRNQSARLNCIYAYASSGPLESTKDTVFSGHMMVAENGQMIAESDRFQLSDQVLYADVDVRKVRHDRIRNGTFGELFNQSERFSTVSVEYPYQLGIMNRTYSKYPFVPDDGAKKAERLEEVFKIQATGLARRLLGAKVKSVVLGLSGGIDSCLALLVALESFRVLGYPPSQIIAVSMPGPGSSKKTQTNAARLADALAVKFKEISIDAMLAQHLSDIQHDPNQQDIVFQNAQARIRTMVLMDLANQLQACVVGTGDLSETALGWCTYNADHMSHYGVNIGVPKTLVQELIRWCKDHHSLRNAKETLDQILATPISPELLRLSPDEEITQETEKELGPYVVHDFILFHFVRNEFPPDKIAYLAKRTFQNQYAAEEIDRWIDIFFKRFFSQQFKRSCMPCGPKVGSVALSPRADWRMPDELSSTILSGE